MACVTIRSLSQSRREDRTLRTSVRVFLVALVVGLAPSDARAADAVALNNEPPALAAMQGFRGRIDYLARREGETQESTVQGTLVIGDHRWTLDERTAAYTLHADDTGASIASHNDALTVGDLFEADSLANAWAAAVAALATQPVTATDTPNSWISSEGIRIYVDASGSQLLGIADVAGRNDIGYVFDEWTQAGPLAVPQQILRLRRGMPDARYDVTSYSVTPSASAGSPVSRPVVPSVNVQPAASARATASSAAVPAANLLQLQLAALACLLLGALFVAVWTRRDALLLTLCRRMARDPRGWRRVGVSIFVGPDGALHFDGLRYRVGPHFYNRAALVQCSTLFLRVSAPGVPHNVILARRFGPAELGIRQRPTRRPTAAGFTLVETLLATTLFSAIVLFGIYPALVVLSRADALAQERGQAVSIASNALEDETAASAYGMQTGTATTVVDGLTLTVAIGPGANTFEHDIDIRVADNAGNVLAHVSSILGPPVKAPPNSSGGPP